jgi:hypothetical protein
MRTVTSGTLQTATTTISIGGTVGKGTLSNGLSSASLFFYSHFGSLEDTGMQRKGFKRVCDRWHITDVSLVGA